MNKLECLEKLLGNKIDVLKSNFKVTMNSKESNENSVFFAINNGNKYVEEASEKGAFVIFDDKNQKPLNGQYVENTIEFMQKLAKLYRKESNFKVIGITGSNGKTTVKDILYSVLKENNKKVYKTQGNYNNHIGMPFTILSSSDDDEILLLEMGMSNLGEIDFLGEISKPDYSIITNIGQSHLEFLKTQENVFKAKCEIIKHTKIKTIVNGEDEYLKRLKNAELVFSEDIKTNLLGKHNKLNVSLAKKLLQEMNIEKINFENIELTAGRFQLIERKDITYINDAYNASPLSMRASIETFSSLYVGDYKIICLGDMLELGDDELKYHEELSDVICKSNFDSLMLYGKRMKSLYNVLSQNKELRFSLKWYENKLEIIEDIDSIETKKRKVVLLKGSRSMKMEEIIKEDD